MKKEAKNRLNREVLKSKVKFYTIFVIPLLIFGALLTVFFPISSNNLEVTAIKYTAEQTEFGNLPIMWAELDNGAIIRVSMPINAEKKQGAKAEIIKTNTLVGVSTYTFVRYVN